MQNLLTWIVGHRFLRHRLPLLRELRRVFFAISVFVSFLPLQESSFAQDKAARTEHDLTSILSYISSGWDTLTRSMTNCDTVVDPKLAEASVLYLPFGFQEPEQIKEMEARCHVKVERLPAAITGPGQLTESINPPGLLYLEHKYVVPGGRFNEMYGWDSYFIVRGLLEDGRIDLARDMVDNFLFEIEHYGTILNANRTYYLTRSQPPFLTSMIVAVYQAEKSRGHADKAWLEKSYDLASRDYEMWNREPHLAGQTGLARYYDFGNGPAPESLKDESGVHRQVADYFLLHGEGRNYIADNAHAGETAVGPQFTVQVCAADHPDADHSDADHSDADHSDAAEARGTACDQTHRISLTADYYKGDRAMRESGFDISFRFKPYGAATHHFAPVCLNSLLYKTERDLQEISEILGRSPEAQRWAKRAEERKNRIQKYLWNEQRGLFMDYNLDSQTQSDYEYITTFYPLWAGLATQEQAKAVMKNIGIFEHAGGLAMSNHDNGVQWDLPYGWAPTQLLAIEGMRRYHFDEDANRVSYKFIAMIAENFRHDGTIREKYNVVTRSSESHIQAGYQQNVVGFGWTNAAFLALLHALPKGWAARLDSASEAAMGDARTNP